MKAVFCLVLSAVLALSTGLASAAPILERPKERRAELDDGYGASGPVAVPAGVRLIRNVAYGPGKDQRYDVYAPEAAANLPVIFMVHGGGWRRGDKAAGQVVANKVARWATRDNIVVSTNYRMLPEADPVRQAQDVAAALAHAQQQAAAWGGERNSFVLMGHSAGAHLVALIASSPALAGRSQWLGTVVLDSAAMDVEQIMQGQHYRLHDQAFGKDPAFWKAASPYAALAGAGKPMLAVCSTRRQQACQQASRYADKAAALGTRMQVLPLDLSHREINETLGQDNAYTRAVDDFLRSVLAR